MDFDRRDVRGQLAVLWTLVFAAGAAAMAIAATPPVGSWMEFQTGETELLPQIKGMTDLLRQAVRPRVHTDDQAPVASVTTSEEFPWGVNTFLQNEVGEARRSRVTRMVAETGFTWIRQPMPWQDVEIHGRGDFEDRRNSPPRSAWYKYDTIVRQAEAHGLEVVFRLDNPPAWSRVGGDGIGVQAPPDDPADFAAFAQAVADRYKGRVRYYQIWNEPNIYPEWGEQPVSPEAYAELLAAAARAIRSVDSDAVIVLAAMAATTAYAGDTEPGGNLNDLIYLQRLYDAGAAEWFDILAVQGYGLWSGPLDRRMHPLVMNFGRVRYVRDLMVRNGDGAKPMWISEMNWNPVPLDWPAPFGRVTPDEQGRFLIQAFRRIEDEWPWLTLANVWYFKRALPDWEERGDPQAWFRLMDHNGKPSQAWYDLYHWFGSRRNAQDRADSP